MKAVAGLTERLGLPPAILNALGYVVATVATGLVSFLTVPLLTRRLGIAEYGRWSLVEPILLLTTQCALLGTNYGIVKAIAQDRRPAARVYVALVVAGLPAALLICAGAAFFLGRLEMALADRVWFVAWAYLETAVALVLAALRGADRPRAYGAATVAKGLVFLAVLVVAAPGGWLRVATAESVVRFSAFAAAAGAGLGLLAVFRIAAGPVAAPARARNVYLDAVRYGLPILAGGLLVQASSFFDRFVLVGVLDSSAVASLVVHAKVASVANPVLTAPLGLWWPTARFNHLNDADGGDAFFRTTALAVLKVYLLVAGTLWFAAPALVGWFARGVRFQPVVVAGHLLAMLCSGMANPLNVGLLQPGRTHLNLYGVVAGAGLQLVLDVVLVPRYGVAGAAWAAAAGAFTAMAVLNALSQRVHPVRFPYARLVGLALSACAAGALVALAVPAASWPARCAGFVALTAASQWLVGRVGARRR